MILSTHAMIGAGAALVAGDPILGFFAGIASHFLSDMIPHWHYPVRSLERKRNPMDNKLRLNRTFLLDLLIIGGECLAGFAIAHAAGTAFALNTNLIFLGAVGGVLPDFLQFLYYLMPYPPLPQIQRFHKWIHARDLLDDLHLVGISAQLLIIALVAWGMSFV